MKQVHLFSNLAVGSSEVMDMKFRIRMGYRIFNFKAVKSITTALLTFHRIRVRVEMTLSCKTLNFILLI